MTREDLLQLHKDTCSKAFGIMEAKNHDYTGGSPDPFANFRATEMLGIPAELGILARCLDKFQRIKSFVVKGELKVKGESVDDAIEDVINYMVLLKGVIKERQTEPIVGASVIEHPTFIAAQQEITKNLRDEVDRLALAQLSSCPTCSQNEALNQPHRPWCGHFLQD